jgi:hypothetical protein
MVAVMGIAFAAAANVLANDSCEAEKAQLASELGRLRDTHSGLVKTNFHLLETLWNKLEAESAVPEHIVDLQRQHGWDDPVAVLTADLTSTPELIAEDADVQGRREWSGIRVRSSRWVFASFKDGRNQNGAMLLEYSIDPEHRIRWERLQVASID